ncbi:MAG TPA: protease complex subunit PrcB family protein [Candidatus Paceibacterota bacterium]|nr:protease complex subunit PrcB family protein [Candidatus Paceibacterota bacterium]
MKDALIIFLMCVAAIVVGALLFFSAPTSLTGTDEPANGEPTETPTIVTEVSFVELDEGVGADVTERKNYAARDEDAYERLWEMAHGEDGKPMPEVDFSKEYVIAAFSGERPSGGHAVAVEKVVDADGVRTVHAALTAPGDGCVVTDAITSPFVFITVPESVNALEAVDATRIEPCT